MKIYVGNLSYGVTEDTLATEFGVYGTVEETAVVTDRETGRPRGFAFVTFSNDTESKLATEKMNGTDLDGRLLTVNEAKPKEESGGAGRSYGSPDRRAGSFQSRGNSRY